MSPYLIFANFCGTSPRVYLLESINGMQSPLSTDENVNKIMFQAHATGYKTQEKKVTKKKDCREHKCVILLLLLSQKRVNAGEKT